MDYRDRKQIDRCCNEISPNINMIDLWPQLLKHRVFNHDDVNVPRWENILYKEDTVRDILDTIKTRGPHAFNNLVLSLRETSHDKEADILEGKTPVVSNEKIPKNNDKPLKEIKESTNSDAEDDKHYDYTKFMTTNEPLVINVKRATEFMDEPGDTTIGKYRMRRKPHGYVLIITIIEYLTLSTRTAAEHDQANLKKLFEDMGFEVTVPDEGTVLTGAEINKIVKEFSQRDFHKVDSCFVIISAHGNEIEHNGAPETIIHGIDSNLIGAEKVFCRDLVEMFSAKNCKHLIEKPKVFIFQACRCQKNEIAEAELKIPRTAKDGSIDKVPLRNYSDILIAHSTIPGEVAYRDEHNGSWYIQILCAVFMRHASTMHITDLFKKVDEILKTIPTLDGTAQTSSVKTMGFSKHLYLNPGIFEDS